MTDVIERPARVSDTVDMSLIDRIRMRRAPDEQAEPADDLDLVALVNEARSDRERSRVVRQAAARHRSRHRPS